MNLFEKLFAEIRGWFIKIPRDVREYATDALEVTRRIRAILTHPVVNIGLAAVPGEWAEALRDEMLKGLDKSIRHLQIVEACKQHDDPAAMLLCWVNELRNMPEHAQKALLFKLASLLTAIRYENNKGEKLRQSLVDTYTQITYANSK